MAVVLADLRLIAPSRIRIPTAALAVKHPAEELRFRKLVSTAIGVLKTADDVNRFRGAIVQITVERLLSRTVYSHYSAMQGEAILMVRGVPQVYRIKSHRFACIDWAALHYGQSHAIVIECKQYPDKITRPIRLFLETFITGALHGVGWATDVQYYALAMSRGTQKYLQKGVNTLLF